MRSVAGVSVSPEAPLVPPPGLCPVAPEPVLPESVTTASSVATWAEDPELPVEAPDPEPADSDARAWASAVSSLDTVDWSVETCCSSAETVSRALSHAAWPVVVLVLALVQSVCACVRSAASCCCALDSADSSWVRAFWSCVTVGSVPFVAPLPPVPEPALPEPPLPDVPPECVGAVVLVVLEEPFDAEDPVDELVEPEVPVDSFASSSASLASSALSVDSSEDTVSVSAVVSNVPSV